MALGLSRRKCFPEQLIIGRRQVPGRIARATRKAPVRVGHQCEVSLALRQLLKRCIVEHLPRGKCRCVKGTGQNDQAVRRNPRRDFFRNHAAHIGLPDRIVRLFKTLTGHGGPHFFAENPGALEIVFERRTLLEIALPEALHVIGFRDALCRFSRCLIPFPVEIALHSALQPQHIGRWQIAKGDRNAEFSRGEQRPVLGGIDRKRVEDTPHRRLRRIGHHGKRRLQRRIRKPVNEAFKVRRRLNQNAGRPLLPKQFPDKAGAGRRVVAYADKDRRSFPALHAAPLFAHSERQAS